MRTLWLLLPPLVLLSLPVKADSQFLVIAHRGASSLAPENTIPAFRIAVERYGAKMIELDVQLSRDGVPMVIHDSTLGRTTDARDRYPGRKKWPVADFTAEELRGLDSGSWFVETDPFGQVGAGAVPPEDLAYYRNGKVGVPTFAEVLQLLAAYDCRVNVELKNFPEHHPDLVPRVVQEIRRAKMEKRCLVSSFHHPSLVEFQRLLPQVERGALFWLPAVHVGDYLRRLDVQAYHPGLATLGAQSAGGLDLASIAEARSAGFNVYVYTVDDPDTVEKLREAGAHGVFTNFIQRYGKGAGRPSPR
ncbi:MAG: glycerophosphodiester phosphodiesterase [Armatimonadetes bacterium]|nr:glycerophosphodiester phosphodiesterase [Armatimonadota bacterium]